MSNPRFHKGLPIAAATFLAGMLVTVGVFLHLRGLERARLHAHLERDTRIHGELLKHKFEEALLVTHSLGQFVAASGDVAPDRFAMFVRPLMPPENEIATMAWVAVVPAERRSAVEGQMSMEAHAPIRIFAIGADGKPVPALARAAYYPMRLAEISHPEGTRPVLGFDMGSTPSRWQTLAKARDSGEVAGSPPIILAGNGLPGFFAVAPVYRNGWPLTSAAERSVALRGFAMVVFQSDRIVGRALGDIGLLGFGITLTDLDAPEGGRTIFSQAAQLATPSRPMGGPALGTLTTTDVFMFANRRLAMTFTPGSAYLQANEPKGLWLVLPVGTLLSLLLATHLWTLYTAQARLQTQVAERTSLLQEHRDHLEELVAERTAQAEERGALLRATIDSTSDFVWSVEPRGFGLVSFNRAFRDYHVVERRQPLVLGLGPQDLVPGDLVGAWLAYYQRALEEGPFVTDYEVASGTRVLSLSFNLIRREQAVIGISVFGKDVTAFKRNEKLLKDAKEAAEAATKAKTEFLANMSHEIRTPMNAVMGMTHLALQTELTVQQRNYLEKSLAAAEGLLGIINDILDFSKIEAGKLQMDARVFLLEEVYHHVTQLLGVKAAEKNLVFQLHRDPQVPSALVGDPLRLGQVLMNLCGNAVKFTESGTVIGVTVSLAGAGPGSVTLRFSVRDTGIGMSEEQTRALFQPFSQVDASSTRRFVGTGLGLAICKRLVDLMGGDLWVVSEPGKGSEFFFTATLGLDQDQAPAQEAPQGEPAPLTSLQGARVLLVEDNDFNQEVASELLALLGVEVTLAANGQEALAQIRSRAFDLVLMDLQMPVMDGYEATRLLRADPAFARLPILAMTAHAMTQERERCAALGMNDYITKPIDPGNLAATLARWARGGEPA